MRYRLLFGMLAGSALIFDGAVADTAIRPSEVETEHIFGFTEGADIGHKGEIELESTATARAGKAVHFAAINDETSLRYGLSDRIRLSFGALADYQTIRGLVGLPDYAGAEFGGLIGELRVKLLDRASSPVGLAVSFNPFWRSRDDTTGAAVSTYALPISLLADTAIVPDKMFAALNITFTPSATHSNGAWQRESTLEISPAITAALGSNVFVGGEIRHLQRSFGGPDAHALFVGPSFFVRLADTAIFKAAWSVQVQDETTGRSDLVSFERHQVRAQLVKSF